MLKRKSIYTIIFSIILIWGLPSTISFFLLFLVIYTHHYNEHAVGFIDHYVRKFETNTNKNKQCKGKYKNGNNCRNKPQPFSDYCKRHKL